MGHLSLSIRPPTHDLIRLREPIALTVKAPAPTWVELALRRTPFAAFLASAEIAGRLSPEDLTDLRYAIAQKRRDTVPAMAALSRT